MRDDLLFYYERELTFLRQMGAEFAEKYPKIASRLVLEAGKCEDPHVERLLEGFAFLAARVHLKLDDDFPEIIEALLSILYPNYIRPIPSMSVVQFHLDPEQGGLTTGYNVPVGSMLLTDPVGGEPCKFRTCFDTTLWPLGVVAAEWKTPDRLQPAIKASDVVAALRIEIRCQPDVTFEKLDLKFLRFYLHGEGTLAHTLIELLCNNCAQIIVRDPSSYAGKAAARPRQVTLPSGSIRQAGFAEEEGMLPFPRRSFLGHRILHEYFTFPEKFCFLDLVNLDQVVAAGYKEALEIIFLISPFERADRKETLETGVAARTFRLGCSPVVNLFKQTADPILLDQHSHEYRVIPDVRRQGTMDIFSIDEVVGVSPQNPEPARYEPFYAFRHANQRSARQAFWHAARRPAGWRADKSADVYLSLVDLTGRPLNPEADTITCRLLCTNRDLPSRLPFGNEEGDFRLDGGGPVTRIVALVKPTNAQVPPLGKSLLWRLISQLSLNYLSLVEDGKDALQEILRLHNFTGSIGAERQVDGVVGVSSRRHFARVVSEHGVTFARGMRVEIEFDEEQFVGAGVYTFASVLEHFLAHYVSLNSFSQLVARTRQRRGVLRQWSPRSGRRILM